MKTSYWFSSFEVDKWLTVSYLNVSFECSKSDILLRNIPISIFCIYRPPPSPKNKLTVKQFLSEFENFIDMYTFDCSNVLILGDFNFHFDCKNELYVKQLIDMIETRSFIQYVNSPTHKAGHTIDWVISKSTDFLNNFMISDVCLSDHFLVSFNICIQSLGRSKRTIYSRDFRSIDNKLFIHDLMSCNTSVIFSHDKASVYFDELSAVLDRHAPLRARCVTDRPSAPWMTSEIKSLKAEKRQAERRWRKTGLPGHRLVFKSLIAKLNTLIAKSKKLFYEAKISADASSKFLYSVVSNFYDKNKSSILPTNLPLNELPKVFNEFFISKITKIRSAFDLDFPHSVSIKTFSGDVLSAFKLLSEKEVKALILSAPAKSCSLDPIPASILFSNIDSVLECITCIINDSLFTGTMPDCLKHAVISPLLKKRNLDQNLLKNYRPVSNLPFISKIVEKAVCSQILNHLKSNDLLVKHQSAYRKLHNTETALVKIQNDLLISADKKEISVIALLDLSAAFDTIDHTILLKRLENFFGFDGTVLNWLNSYLSGRSQCVKIDNVTSDPTPLSFGVPQGSVLGPILYTLYTTPLGNIIKNHNLNYHMYADDTQLYLSIEPTNLSDLIHSFEKCIHDVKNWMLHNRLKLNDEKTEIIVCNPKKFPVLIDEITVGQDKVKFSKSAKNLGVIFDDDLSMDTHVKSLCKGVYLEIRRLKHMSRFVDEQSLKTLAASFILSKFDYCNALFKKLNCTQIQKLQKLQNFAARVICRKSIFEHVTPCLIYLHWLPIKYRVDFKIAMLVFKCLNGLAPSYLSELLEIYQPNRNLRSCNKFLLQSKRTNFKTLGDKSFSSAAPVVWNALPFYLRSETSLSAFKTKLKTFYFREAFQQEL